LLETVNFVTPQVAVGGRYFWPRRLRRAGITHVLSARRRTDQLDGFTCLSNPMEDTGADQEAAYWLRGRPTSTPSSWRWGTALMKRGVSSAEPGGRRPPATSTTSKARSSRRALPMLQSDDPSRRQRRAARDTS
jgi:hypothetical protein